MPRNGKTFNEYMHQTAPGAPVVQFSDKPIKVGGVRYFPKWPWSDDYRRHFRQDHRDWPTNADSHEVQYLNWLRCERMPNLDLGQALDLVKKQRQAA